MRFRLDDGKPMWAIATAQIEREALDEQGQPTIVTETIYLYDPSEMAEYPDPVLLDQPTPEILARGAEIEGRTLSRSEFERMLFEKTPEDLRLEEETKIQLALAELAEAQEADKTAMQRALVELAELYMGGT
ncbi:hypothetical protein [Cohnella boryungensis]|uniref:Bacteriophage SP-beta YorD domain-containing protein n=1 Tax=Cohnella boryungensis TaxID=768479 RepID=A0ABV8SEF1_9BACL